jgi:Trp operon repressor
MSRGNTSKEALNSSAHLSKIKTFVPQRVTYEEPNKATFAPYRFTDYKIQISDIEDGIIRDFPILFMGNGEPWDLGNLFLMWKMSVMAQLDPPNVQTLHTYANHLLLYRRWIEHNQAEGNALHELHFPEDRHERVTYRYRRYLLRQIRKTPPPISIGVAKARMSTVVSFYRGLIDGRIVEESRIENPAYESKIAGIPIVTALGLKRVMEVETTDLSIRKPSRESEPGFLSDGGKLRPLSFSEQKIISNALSEYGNRVFELIMRTALTTGARKQTVCTLRVKHIRELLEKNKSKNELKLKIGAGTSVDVKTKGNNKFYRLHVPRQVAEMLIEYADSQDAIARRRKSFYGDVDDNYLFLTEDGSPYYTSNAEVRDRQNPAFSTRISMKDRVNFSIKTGKAVNNLLGRLIKSIQLKHEDFSKFQFHDTRATYGMNFVRYYLSKGISPDAIVEQLRIRMGHNNIQTTYGYLSYDKENELISALDDAYDAYLFALSPGAAE